MDDQLDGLTLAGWAAGVWYKHRRGVALSGHEAAIVYCMEYHAEWRSRWDSLGTSNDPEVSRDVLHVHYDAMVKMQIDDNEPPEIREHYQKLRDKGFTEFEAIHTLIPALSETLYATKTKNEPFDKTTYLRHAAEYVKLALQRPVVFRRHEK
jgi:hypothetical protein